MLSGILNPASLDKPYVIVGICLVVFFFILGAVLFPIYLYFRRRKARHENLKTEIYFCSYEGGNEKIHVIPRHEITSKDDDFIGGFDVSLDQFLRIFSIVDSDADMTVEDWLKGLLKQKKQPLVVSAHVALDEFGSVFPPSLQSYASRAILYGGEDDVDPMDATAGFLISMQPSISRAVAHKRSRFLSYRQYLRTFRYLMKRGRRAQFIYVSLSPDAKAKKFLSGTEEQEYQTAKLGDYLARGLVKNTYLVKVDARSLMLIDLRPQPDPKYDARVNRVIEDVEFFLKVNSVEDRYTPTIGQTIYAPGKSIESLDIAPLAYYVSEARKDAEDNLANTIFLKPDSNTSTTSGREVRQSFIRAIDDGTYRLYFNPYFTLNSGDPYMYVLSIAPFFSYDAGYLNIDGEAFLEEAKRLNRLSSLLDSLAVRIAQRNVSGGRLRLVVPWKLGLIDDMLDSDFVQKIGNFDLYLSFSQAEIERYGGRRLEDQISRVNSEGIKTILSLNNRPPAVDDSTMKLFSMFEVRYRYSDSPVSDMRGRANTLSALSFLKPYNKPVALGGLTRGDETYFALIHGICCVSSNALCPPSSIFETLNSEGRDIISRINSARSIRKQ